MRDRNARVDTYIANAAEFAQPILEHLREVVHRGCPAIVEEIKWGRPCFVYCGQILCGISAFKQHCAFGFWGAEIGHVLRADGVVQDGAMGTFGRITSLKDLPSDKRLVGYIRQAANLVDQGRGESAAAAARRGVKVPKPAVEPPAEFTAALKKSKGAAKVFDTFSASCRREYIEWISEAKRPETRQRRIEQAMEWIAEGKQRNWKYQNC